MTEQQMIAPEKEVILRVSTEEVYPNDYNANKMAPHVFNEIASDIASEGMDQPVVVVLRPVEGSTKKYRIVDGEHRWRAQVAAGAKTILISLKDWTDKECIIHTVRRNLRGTPDPAAFTKMVNRLREQDNMDLETIRKRMVMQDKEFAKLYQGNTPKKSAVAAQVLSQAEKGSAELFLVANLSQMVREIVKKYGDNIQQGFICFAYKGQTHLLVSMDPTLLKAVQEFKSAVEEDKLSQEEISKKLSQALNKVS